MKTTRWDVASPKKFFLKANFKTLEGCFWEVDEINGFNQWVRYNLFNTWGYIDDIKFGLKFLDVFL